MHKYFKLKVVILTLNASKELKLNEKGLSVSDLSRINQNGFEPFKWVTKMK